MQRNIVTSEDVYLATSSTRRGEPGTAAEPPQLTADDYWARLVKYVPLEIISAYLVLRGLIESAYADRPRPLAVALAVLLFVGVLASWLFARRVLRIVRIRQAAMTAGGFAVWVFATGGWFATTHWYEPWMGTAAVVAFGVGVRILVIPPLPEGVI